MDTIVETNDTPVTDELTKLKAQANSLGIKFNAKIGIDKLIAKIESYTDTALITKTEVAETISARNSRLRRDASRLIRVIVHCLNPDKRQWPGATVSIGNSVVGFFKKYIPFETEVGYHIPNIIYKQLLEKECQIFYTIKGRNGRPDQKRGKLIKEYNIEVLPPLTRDELKDLADQQAVNQSID